MRPGTSAAATWRTRRASPVVVDWRAPVAVPFYRATFADRWASAAAGASSSRGRSLDDVLDEDFDDPDTAAAGPARGLPDPLLAELGRARDRGDARHRGHASPPSRTGSSGHRSTCTVVVQGGPGTGKTAVGLHRAAFLLYEHRQRLRTRRVCSSSGPTASSSPTSPRCSPPWARWRWPRPRSRAWSPAWPVPARASPHAVAALKGDAAHGRRSWPPSAESASPRPGSRSARSPGGAGSPLAPESLDGLLEAARASGGTARRPPQPLPQGRSPAAVTAPAGRPPGHGASTATEVAQDLGADRPLQAALERMWPTQSAPALVRRLYGRSGRRPPPRRAGSSPAEQALLGRTPGRSVRQRGLDRGRPAAPRRGGVRCCRRRRAATGTWWSTRRRTSRPWPCGWFGRRSTDGRSLTVLGDLGQATAPGAPGGWVVTLAALGDPGGARVVELPLGYRVPAAIMELANRVLAADGAAPPGHVARSGGRTDDGPESPPPGPSSSTRRRRLGRPSCSAGTPRPRSSPPATASRSCAAGWHGPGPRPNAPASR